MEGHQIVLPEGFQVWPKKEIKDINPIDKEGRQTFLGYEDQNHSHNNDNQRQTGKGQTLSSFSRREFFEGESNF